MQQYHPQIDKKWQNLISTLQSKSYETAIFIVQEIDKTDQLIDRIKKVYTSTLITDEDEYQEWLYIVALALAPKLTFKPCYQLIQLIIGQIVGHSSPKYLVIILRSLIHKIKNSMFAKYVILTCIHFLGSLLFDPTIQDLILLYHELNQVSNALLIEVEQFEQANKIKLLQITMESKIRLLHVFWSWKYTVNSKYIQQVIDLITEVVRDLLIVNSHQSLAALLQKYQIKSILQDIPKQFIGKFSIDLVNYEPTILFTRCLLNETATKQLSFDSAVYSTKIVTIVIISTINKTLVSNLSEPSQLIKLQCQFIDSSIRYIADQLMQKNNYIFVIDHFELIEQLIEKLNIYLGAINPQQELYKIINNVFCNMMFLEAKQKERILSKLIHKHCNLSFKGHLISLYRKLLNFKCSKTIIIKSTSLLFEELRRLEPKISIDYIGHILSFAFYWRQVIAKLNLKIHLLMNMEQLISQFNDILTKLRNGLQLRVQVLQSQNSNQQQRNEIQVCLFRITDILNPNQN